MRKRGEKGEKRGREREGGRVKWNTQYFLCNRVIGCNVNNTLVSYAWDRIVKTIAVIERAIINTKFNFNILPSFSGGKIIQDNVLVLMTIRKFKKANTITDSINNGITKKSESMRYIFESFIDKKQLASAHTLAREVGLKTLVFAKYSESWRH